jgi:branched-chain amino acid transport system permease protein
MQAELGQLLASLGLSAIMVSAVAHWTKSSLQPISGDVYESSVVNIFGARVLTINLIIIVTAVVLITATVMLVQRTSFGRALRAVAFSPASVQVMGINPQYVTGMTMLVSGALAGVAGVLVAVQQLGIEAHSGDLFILKGFAVVILGGAGSIIGTAVGALLLAAAETLTVVYVGSGYRDLVAFAVIIAVLLLKPGGLFATAKATRA